MNHQQLSAAGGGAWDKADEHYQTAVYQAREPLTEAIAMYRRIGMPKHVGMAEALLAAV